MRVPTVGGVMAVSVMVMTSLMVMQGVLGCNEAVCASIVSKCMLLQSCKCELGPECTCCKVRAASATHLRFERHPRVKIIADNARNFFLTNQTSCYHAFYESTQLTFVSVCTHELL